MTVLKLRAARDRIRSRGEPCEGRKPFGSQPGDEKGLARIRELYRKPFGKARKSLQEICDILNTEGARSASPSAAAACPLARWGMTSDMSSAIVEVLARANTSHRRFMRCSSMVGYGRADPSDEGVYTATDGFRETESMHTRVFVLIAVAAAYWFVAAPPAHAQKFVPTNQFARGKIQDFEVMIHTKILEDERLGHAVKMETARQLHHIEQSIPAEPLKVLRQVRVWIVRHGEPNESSATYHPDPRWLRDNGYNPDMAGGIGVPDAERFLEFSKTKHFNILLHEMAHAYEFRSLGPENPELKATYQRAMNAGLYRDTYHSHSHHEYFAELTEAYFGKNDYAPKTREEAKKYDPAGVEFLERAWKLR